MGKHTSWTMKALKRGKPLETPSTAFFARLHSADLACPRCDYVTRIGTRGATRRERASEVGDRTWNPLTCRWRCPRCKLTLRLGIVAFPVLPRSKSHLPPRDTVPSYAQALGIRQEISRIVAARSRMPIRTRRGKNGQPRVGLEVNRRGPEVEGCLEDDLARLGEEGGGDRRGDNLQPDRAKTADPWTPREGPAGAGKGGE